MSLPSPPIAKTPFDPSKAPEDSSAQKKPATISYKTPITKTLAPKSRKQSLSKKLESQAPLPKPVSDPQQLPYKPPKQSMEQPLLKSNLKWQPTKHANLPHFPESATQSSKRLIPSRQKPVANHPDQSASASLFHGKNRDSGDDAAKGAVGAQRAATFPRRMTLGRSGAGPVVENKRNHSRASSISSEPSSLVSDASFNDPVSHTVPPVPLPPPSLPPSQIPASTSQNSVYWYSPFSSGLTIDLGSKIQRQDPFLQNKLGLATAPNPLNAARHSSPPPGLSQNPIHKSPQQKQQQPRNFSLGGPSLLWDTTEEDETSPPQHSMPVNPRFSLFEQRF
jgi:hypothetical protein